MISLGHLRYFRLLILALATVSTPTQVVAARKSTPVEKQHADIAPQALFPDAFRNVLMRGISNGVYHGIAVGVIDGRQRESLYLGHRDGPTSPAPDAGSLFEIGAVSEIFTNLLLAKAVLDGRLRLTDPISRFLPDGFPFSDPRIASISLDALATQRSGFVPVPLNLFPDVASDPYASYATEDLLAFLAFYRGDSNQNSAENQYSYSILNCGLLGHLLGRLYGAPFTDVLAKEILSPLGMPHAPPGAEIDLLQGHAQDENVARSDYAALSGAAGLRANLPTLLDFMQLNLTPGDSPLRRVLLLARQPRATGDGGDQVGLGWNIRQVASGDETWPLVWRASETAGFSVFVGFRTDRQKAIVLLGNTADDLAAIGLAWLVDARPPAPPPSHTKTKDVDLAAYPGLYRITSDSELVVRAFNGTLTLQMPGEMPQRLHSVDADVFISDSGLVGLTFMRDVDTISGLVLHVNGNHISAPRLSDRAPRVLRTPIKLTVNERDQFLGDYRMDAHTWMRIGRSGDGLAVQLTMSERHVVYPYARDRFADAGGVVDLAFSRGAEGRIIGATVTLGGVQRDATPLRRTPL